MLDLDLDPTHLQKSHAVPEVMIVQRMERLIVHKVCFEDMYRMIIRYRPRRQKQTYETNQLYTWKLFNKNLVQYGWVPKVILSRRKAGSTLGTNKSAAFAYGPW